MFYNFMKILGNSRGVFYELFFEWDYPTGYYRICQLFQLLWVIGLDKNYKTFNIEYTCYFEISNNCLCTLDVCFVSYKLLIGIFLF